MLSYQVTLALEPAAGSPPTCRSAHIPEAGDQIVIKLEQAVGLALVLGHFQLERIHSQNQIFVVHHVVGIRQRTEYKRQSNSLLELDNYLVACLRDVR